MRSLWMASAAVLFTAGAALAQTSSPAPTGAPNAAQATPTGSTASPGNMAPSTPPADSSSMSNMSSGGTPAPTGAPKAANVTQPGASPGNMAPASTATNMTPASPAPAPAPMGSATPEAMPPHHMAMSHMMSHGMSMPADADAGTYLHIASMAIKHGDKSTADEALSRAETRLLTRAVSASDASSSDDSPAVDAVEKARMAVHAGNMKDAEMDTKMAMHAVHGGMGPMGSSMSN